MAQSMQALATNHQRRVRRPAAENPNPPGAHQPSSTCTVQHAHHQPPLPSKPFNDYGAPRQLVVFRFGETRDQLESDYA